mmetsp:Transcript_28330/g.52174  ORF Transcript_28330/g.52174 Transcript_28330/m.52174 type:complete len:124 (-) Transcript_28330:399-770(-)
MVEALNTVVVNGAMMGAGRLIKMTRVVIPNNHSLTVDPNVLGSRFLASQVFGIRFLPRNYTGIRAGSDEEKEEGKKRENAGKCHNDGMYMLTKIGRDKTKEYAAWNSNQTDSSNTSFPIGTSH